MTDINVVLFYKLLDKKFERSDVTCAAMRANTAKNAIKSEVTEKQRLTDQLRKLIIRKLQKRKIHSYFIDKIWRAYLADM